MKKPFVLFMILLLVAGIVGAALFIRGRQSEANTDESRILRKTKVVREDLNVTVIASGNLVADKKLSLSFGTTGIISDIDVEVGDYVEKGQILARLDTSDFEKAVEQAELSLQQAELNLAILREPADEDEIELTDLSIRDAAHSITVAKASEELAQAQAARDIRIAKENREDAQEALQNVLDTLDDYRLPEAYAAPASAAAMEAAGNVGVTLAKAEHDIQQAQSQWLRAYESYKRAQNQRENLTEGPDLLEVERLQLQIEQAKLDLLEAKDRVEDALLTAPFDGTISQINLTEGQPATTEIPALKILDISTFYVELTIDEIDIGRISPGQPAEITLDAYPDLTVKGEVDLVKSIPKEVGGVIAYPVRVIITESSQVPLLDGMTASARLTVEQIENVLLIPNWAVRTDQASSETYTYCYCIEGSEIRRKPIETGARNENYTQVISGLEEGETVALVSEERSLLDFQGPPSTGN
jgi:HlyD family secretion protein